MQLGWPLFTFKGRLQKSSRPGWQNLGRWRAMSIPSHEYRAPLYPTLIHSFGVLEDQTSHGIAACLGLLRLDE